MFNLANFRHLQTVTRSVTPGASITAEGQILKSVLTQGQETLQPATGAAGEVLVGFAIQRNLRPSTKVVVETLAVNVANGGTVTLSHSNLVSSTLRVQAKGEDVAAGTTGSTYSVNLTSGVVTFNAATTASVTFTYVYNLTATEADILFKNAPIGSNASSVWGTATAAVGFGEITTDQFDTTKDYTTVTATTNALTAGAAGIITVGGNGTVIPGGRVIKTPTSDDPLLTIGFNFAG